MDLLSGAKLQYASSGEPVTDSLPELLEDKLVGLFFSASWCAVTTKFLDTLSRFYESVVQRNGNLVIVCVPFDKTEEDMRHFYRITPRHWLNVALADQTTIRNLQEKFRVTAVPRLVIVSDEGELLSHHGRKDIQDKGITGYRVWYDRFRPPGTQRRKLKAAVLAVVAVHGGSAEEKGELQPMDTRTAKQVDLEAGLEAT